MAVTEDDDGDNVDDKEMSDDDEDSEAGDDDDHDDDGNDGEVDDAMREKIKSALGDAAAHSDMEVCPGVMEFIHIYLMDSSSDRCSGVKNDPTPNEELTLRWAEKIMYT